ncbi:MAG: Gfo/Idh/MocA family oxidoreductase [Candidatus Caenarcaniphilales bacterium]|nr:Gfo/Idh/MocA family oxidoreductase [Candidatus Caenarcaniphilales bacterium]
MIGLIGAGRWGENLVRNFFQLGVLSAVCDKNPEVLQKIAAKFPTIKLVDSFNQLLEDPSIMAIVVATPSVTHYDLAKQALIAGKHVYVEKPLAKTEREANELIELAKELNLTLMVGHLLLYHPAVNKLRELIAKGELGKIRFLNSDRRNFALSRMDTNVIWDLAPHDMSMISYILSNDAIELLDANGFSTAEDGVIDVAHVDIKFKGEIYAHIHNSWIDPQKQCLLTVNGSKKTAVLNDTRQEQKLELYSFLPDGQILVEHPVYTTDEPLRLECLHFINCIKKNERPLSDGINGYRIVKVLEEADSMMRSDNFSNS